MFQRPGQFRWVYAKPVDQVIVGDGERVWIHDRDLNQVTVRKLVARARLDARGAARRLGRHREGVRAVRGRQRRTAWSGSRRSRASARPASSACAWASTPSGCAAMELVDHFGQTTLLRFANLERNPKVDPAEFRFEPPKGADVLGREVNDLFGKREPAAPLAERCGRSRSTRSSASSHLLGPGQAAAPRLRVGQAALDDPVGPAGLGQDHARAPDGEGVRRRVHRALGGARGREGHPRGGAARRARRSRASGRHTILFVDEVHRFNKAQQDAFLPYVERGLITFVGATTENPSFEVNSALLSRAAVYVLEPLERRRPGRAAVARTEAADRRRSAKRAADRLRRRRRAAAAERGRDPARTPARENGRRRVPRADAGEEPAALRQGRRAVLRPDLGAAQVGARLRPGRRALLDGAHARRRRRPAATSAGAWCAWRSRTSASPTRARCASRSTPARPTSASAARRASSRSPRR